MLIMLIMLIKKVAQSFHLGNKAEFVHWPIGSMTNQKTLHFSPFLGSMDGNWTRVSDKDARILSYGTKLATYFF